MKTHGRLHLSTPRFPSLSHGAVERAGSVHGFTDVLRQIFDQSVESISSLQSRRGTSSPSLDARELPGVRRLVQRETDVHESLTHGLEVGARGCFFADDAVLRARARQRVVRREREREGRGKFERGEKICCCIIRNKGEKKKNVTDDEHTRTRKKRPRAPCL